MVIVNSTVPLTILLPHCYLLFGADRLFDLHIHLALSLIATSVCVSTHSQQLSTLQSTMKQVYNSATKRESKLFLFGNRHH